MPAYGSQATTNSPLVAVTPDQTVPAILFSGETPATGTKSIAVVLMGRKPESGFTPVAIRFSSPLGVGAGVFQIQDADFDADAEYDSINFGGAAPGQVVAANFNAQGVCRVELSLRARFLRILVVTGPSNPITITAE